MDGGAGVSAVPVYHRFVELGKGLKPQYLTMIMPAKWYNSGRGLEQFRIEMLNDRRIQALYDYPDPHECFPTVDIAGGICYFLWNTHYNGKCKFVSCKFGNQYPQMRHLNYTDVLIRNSVEIDVIKKIQSKNKDFLSAQVFSQKPFGLRTYEKPLQEGDILLRCNNGTGYYLRDKVTTNIALIDKWKVITSCLTAEHAGETDKKGQKRILSTLEILPPGTICTETYMLLNVFDSEEESNNFMAYLKTKFVRSLISIVTATQHMSKSNFRFVPLQDFHSLWTDEELFSKYCLNDEEIAFIEQTIKPME